MSTRFPLDACRAARLPVHGLAALAALRASSGVRVIIDDLAWVEWDSPRADVVAAILTVNGAEFFEARGGKWFSPGSHLPIFDLPPHGNALPLDRTINPAPFSPIVPPGIDLR